VYPRYGLRQLVDLGEWWESETGLPIPLGCIALRDRDGEELRTDVNAAIKRSVEYARARPEASLEYVRSHAQEMDDDVVRRHIGLYVNEYTVDLGETGHQAISKLEDMALCRGILRQGS
jgi:1,4-dihydroxy-6-naphthoate synthase